MKKEEAREKLRRAEEMLAEFGERIKEIYYKQY